MYLRRRESVAPPAHADIFVLGQVRLEVMSNKPLETDQPAASRAHAAVPSVQVADLDTTARRDVKVAPKLVYVTWRGKGISARLRAEAGSEIDH